MVRRCASFLLGMLALGGCGRVGFDSLDDDPNLMLHVTFEGSNADVARGHSAACTSCPLFVSGRGGSVASFTGSQCLRIDDDDAFHVQQFTLALWLRPAVMTPLSVFSKPYQEATGGENSWQVFLLTGQVVFGTRSATGDYLFGGPLGLGDWRHVTATFDSETKQVYVDGAPFANSAIAPIVYDTSTIRIGCDLDIGAETVFYKGEIDDVRFYDRVLSPNEIAILAQ